jgi:hypothetical protein
VPHPSFDWVRVEDPGDAITPRTWGVTTPTPLTLVIHVLAAKSH